MFFLLNIFLFNVNLKIDIIITFFMPNKMSSTFGNDIADGAKEFFESGNSSTLDDALDEMDRVMGRLYLTSNMEMKSKKLRQQEKFSYGDRLLKLVEEIPANAKIVVKGAFYLLAASKGGGEHEH